MPPFRSAALIAFLVLVRQAEAAGPSLLIDPATEDVISQDRAGEVWYPASLTKLLTAYVVFARIREGALSLGNKVPVSELANSQPPSKIGVPPGGMVTVDFALQALLVHSANDMAYVLAEAAAGSAANFVTAMNGTATRLGMTGSHFVNPNGLYEPRQVTTARDMAVLAAAILREFPEYGHYFSQPNVKAGKRRLANHNRLLRSMPEADGMKTGFVCNSGFNLVASAGRDGRRLLAVVLGAATPKNRADLAQLLLVDGFARTERGERPKLSQLSNQRLGALVPADMTAAVCKRDVSARTARDGELRGWGISLGQYATAREADMALRGRLLDRAAIGIGGMTGVIRMPGKSGFAAMVWNLDQAASREACAAFESRQVHCEAVAPEYFALIAAASPKREAGKTSLPAQGSEGAKKRKKKKR